jgi:glycosyltransferase involved in cell wall biosynthesis
MKSEQIAAPRSSSIDSRVAALRRIAVIPALNEEDSIAGVIAEIRAADPGFEVIVVDDGSTDRTAAVAAKTGAQVLRLPFNLGIGGAVQTGLQYARDHDFDISVQIDADGQHDPRELPKLLAPLIAGEADVVVGSRFLGGEKNYNAPILRRVGIRSFAGIISVLVGQPLTDTSSSFRAFSRRAIVYFARDYPHGFVETVEATVIAARCGLRLKEVPVVMRQRLIGQSSLTLPLSVYYSIKVLVAVFVGIFRRNAYELKED